MKNRTLLMVLMAGLPWLAMAQSNDDDLYFVPKKEKRVEKKETTRPVQNRSSNTTVFAAPGSTVVVKDVSGKTRNIDEYNRRYTARDNKFESKNDTLYIEEKPYGERGEWVNGFEGSQDDYEYAMRIVRFRNPRYAIPVSSPLYWDVVYGAFPSWEWNVYDDGFYAYVFPTFSNPLWWDWRWNWSIGGPRWGFGWSWSSPYYYSSWYGPNFYGGYWGGYGPFGYPGWGGPHPHHGPYYSWGGGYRSGYTDYRPSRYMNSLRYADGNANSFNRYTRPSRNGAYERGNREFTGRVVSPDGRDGYSVVRPSGNNSSFRRGGASNVENGGATRSESSVRGNAGSYVRPSSVIDRSGSTYNRPSSTRRSVNYNRSNNESPNRSYESRPSNSNSNSYSRGSDFNRGSSVGNGGFSRGSSMGGGNSRGPVGGGGSSRRR